MQELPANFPYKAQNVCYVYVGNDGTVTCPHYKPERQDAVRNVAAGKGRLFGAWPGNYRTDLFPLTDIHALRLAFGVASP